MNNGYQQVAQRSRRDQGSNFIVHPSKARRGKTKRRALRFNEWIVGGGRTLRARRVSGGWRDETTGGVDTCRSNFGVPVQKKFAHGTLPSRTFETHSKNTRKTRKESWAGGAASVVTVVNGGGEGSCRKRTVPPTAGPLFGPSSTCT